MWRKAIFTTPTSCARKIFRSIRMESSRMPFARAHRRRRNPPLPTLSLARLSAAGTGQRSARRCNSHRHSTPLDRSQRSCQRAIAHLPRFSRAAPKRRERVSQFRLANISLEKIAETPSTNYMDAQIQFGNSYVYSVRSVAPSTAAAAGIRRFKSRHDSCSRRFSTHGPSRSDRRFRSGARRRARASGAFLEHQP